MISNFKLQHSLLESLQRNAASLNTDWKEFLENHLAIGIRRLKMLTLFDPVIPVIGINPEGIIESKVKDGHTRMLIAALFIFMQTGKIEIYLPQNPRQSYHATGYFNTQLIHHLIC